MTSTSHRRNFLKQTAFGSALFTTPGLMASVLEDQSKQQTGQSLLVTPHQTEGPFYPDKLPLDTDNDLLVLNDAMTPAVGQITHLTGRVLSKSGEPIRSAIVEIWQSDARGVYLHSGSANKSKQDVNFQGFGRFMTGLKGEYYFRTIKPVPYTGRPPHIHVAVYQGGKRMLTTQCYIKGHKENTRDRIFRSAKNRQDHPLLVDFKPLKNSSLGELAARFDIVLGKTPEDPKHDQFHSGRGRKAS